MFALLIISCHREKPTNEAEYFITIDMNEAQQIFGYDWFSSIELVPLETNSKSLIHRYSKMINHDNNFYIFDDKQDIIFIFDAKGNFLFSSASKEGQGPGEYYGITDFDIEKSTNTIHILDPSAFKIRKYDISFNHIQDYNLTRELLPFISFTCFSEDLYIFYNMGESNEILRVFSIQENKIIGKIGTHPSNIRDIKIITEENIFREYNHNCFFTCSYPNNDLYKIDHKALDLENIVTYDFGKYTLDIEKLPREDLTSIDMNKRFVVVIKKFQNEKNYFTFVSFKDELFVIKLDKENGSYDIISCKFKEGGILLPPLLIDDDCFYIITENQYLDQVVCPSLLDENSKNILANLQEDDNPVIIKYVLK